ncbi:hypothetical protein [Caenispirillum salinarum]|uniref:hypothetical protein n=1 Tax=Caenispirillum salinarum TaxID=859058 RepID=UPI0038512A90
MRTPLAAAAALGALLASPALAQPQTAAPDPLQGQGPAARPLPMSTTCLVNSEWDLEEMLMGPQDFTAVMRDLHMAWDEDGDGALTPEEYNTCTRRLDLPATFVAFDHDADGAISQDEWTSAENFEAMDINNDGKLVKGEFLFDDALTADGADNPE